MISCEILLNAGDEQLEEKAVKSWDEFMGGNISYYLKVPLKNSGGIPQLSIVDHFSKSNRPKAWKATDMKIENTVPILGLDLSDGIECDFQCSSTVIVKVTLNLTDK